MSLSRRALLGAAGTAAAAAALQVVPSSSALAQRPAPTRPRRQGARARQARRVVVLLLALPPQDQPYPIEKVIEHAASVGVEGVDILHRQMTGEDNAYLQRLKKHAFVNGIDLIALSIHQGFVFPDAAERQKNIDHTIHCMELAYAMGIPCLRLNTGRWNTTKSFDDLMANKGIEPVLPGVTEDQGFEWCISSIEKLLPTAEKLGVLLALENHWGLARTADGLMRIVNAVNSPWLGVLADTGNFLDDQYGAVREDRAQDGLRAGQDLRGRRRVVFARHRLRPHREDSRGAAVPRLRVAGVRRQGAGRDGGAQGRRAAARGVQGVGRGGS